MLPLDPVKHFYPCGNLPFIFDTFFKEGIQGLLPIFIQSQI